MIDISKKRLITITIILFLLTPLLNTSSAIQTKNKTFLTEYETQIDNIIFDLKMKTIMKIGQCPSLSTCIIKNDSIAWAKSYGYYDLYHRKQATPDTIYMTSSVTKPVTATAIMQLYEKGLIDLDEDINTYLPFSLRNPKYPDDKITTRMLLSHRAGIYDYCIYKMRGIIYLYNSYPHYNELGNWINQTLTPQGNYYKPDYWLDLKPGEQAYYSNLGYLVLGYILDRVTNTSFSDYVEENIFTPLQMNSTSLCTSEIDKTKAAVGYIHRLGVYIPLQYYYHSGFRSVAGMKTTINDFSHFIIAHMNKGVYKNTRILNESTIELMHNTIYPSDAKSSPLPSFLEKHSNRTYGLGIFKCKWFGDRETLGHFGMSPGTTAFMMINQSTNTGFIAFSNHFDVLGFFDPKFLLKMNVFYKFGELLFEKSETL